MMPYSDHQNSQKKKKMAVVSSRNVGSLKGRTSAMNSNGRLVGGILDRTARLANTKATKTRKAQIRIAHAKPTFGMRWTSMMGKITPPSEEPDTTSPSAAPRLAWNQVETYLQCQPCAKVKSPVTYSCERRVKHHGSADGGANSLAQQDLVILHGQAGHHQTKDMEESSCEQQRFGPVFIVDPADKGSTKDHEEDCIYGRRIRYR
jgi:5-methylcytosine-specific restriction endonuclease McrA